MTYLPTWMRAQITALAVVSLVGSAQPTDQPLAGTKIAIKRAGSGKETLGVVLKDPALLFPLFDELGDPTIYGLTIELFGAGGERATFAVPAGIGKPGWKRVPGDRNRYVRRMRGVDRRSAARVATPRSADASIGPRTRRVIDSNDGSLRARRPDGADVELAANARLRNDQAMARLTKLSRSVAGRIVCVTGAASGMGRATAHLFADEGARVAVVDVTPAGVDTVVDEITTAGSDAAGFIADLADAGACEALVRDVIARFGGLDVLVNNAGVVVPSTIDGAEWAASWERTLAVNLTAYARLVRGFLPWLEAKRAGRVVNVASTEGVGASYGVSAYTASKHGVIGLTRSLAIELGNRGVTVNCVCPGPINTGMTAAIPDEAKTRFARRKVPLQRYGEPEEVAHATLSLALPGASFINGAVLIVDGGMTAKNDLGTATPL